MKNEMNPLKLNDDRKPSFTNDPEAMEFERKYLDIRPMNDQEADKEQNCYSVLVEYDYHNGIWKEKFVKIARLRNLK